MSYLTFQATFCQGNLHSLEHCQASHLPNKEEKKEQKRALSSALLNKKTLKIFRFFACILWHKKNFSDILYSSMKKISVSFSFASFLQDWHQDNKLSTFEKRVNKIHSEDQTKTNSSTTTEANCSSFEEHSACFFF